MEKKEKSMLSSIFELIWQLRLELSLDRHERLDEAQEALAKPTSTPEEVRQKVESLLFFRQRIQENQDLIKSLDHYVDVALRTTDHTERCEDYDVADEARPVGRC